MKVTPLPKQRRLNILRVDPSRTGLLRTRFRADLRRRFAKIRKALWDALVNQDVLGIAPKTMMVFHASPEPQAFRFQTNPQKMRSFQRWFQKQVNEDILSVDAQGKPWTAQYVNSAYRQGIVRAYVDKNKEALAKSKIFYEGGKEMFLRQAFSAPESVQKIEMLYQRSFDQLKGITEQMGQSLSRELSSGLANGLNPRTIARKISNSISGIERKRAEVIARTEIIYAHAEGQLDSFERQGVRELNIMAEWSTAGDDRVCEQCAPLEGVVLTVKEARGMIPRHPNCVLGDSRVWSPSPTHLTRAKFTGIVMEVLTAKGRRFSVTKNHVLLTHRGWVPAKLLADGDYLLEAPVLNGVCVQRPYDDHDITSIENLFTSALERAGVSRHTRTDVSSEDFHGDGKFIQGEIDIISVDSLLGCYGNTERVRDLLEHPLVTEDVPISDSEFLNGRGLLSERFMSAAAATDCIMGLLGVASIFLRGSAAHHNSVGLDLSPAFLVPLKESAPENSASISGDRLELQQGDSGLVLLERIRQNILRNVDLNLLSRVRSGADQSEFVEFLSKCLRIASCPPRNMLATETVSVHLDRVRIVSSSFHSDLLVYDMSTHETVYSLNGIMSSNCRCTWIPANVGEDTEEQITSASGKRQAVRESLGEGNKDWIGSEKVGMLKTVDTENPLG